MENPETIPVEVIYALPGEQRLFSLRVIRGASVLQALQESGVLLRYPQIDPGTAKLGIFGRRVEAEAILSAGDRVEIYRDLSADPKVVRRQRVEKKRRLQRGGR